jgi:hypothetical protein
MGWVDGAPGLWGGGFVFIIFLILILLLVGIN